MNLSSEKLAGVDAGWNPRHASVLAEADEGSTGLDDAARSEREYVRSRLREELQHEPTEEEIDEWLREHTEGY